MKERITAWFDNLAMMKKLVISFSVIGGIAVIIGVLGINELNKAVDGYKDLYVAFGASQGDIAQVAINYQLSRVAVKEIFINSDVTAQRKYADAVKMYDANMDKYLELFQKSIRSSAAQQELDQLKTYFSEYKEKRNRGLDIALSGKTQEANEYIQKEVVGLAANVQKYIDVLIERKTETGFTLSTELEKNSNKAEYLMIGFIALGVLLALSFGYGVARRITTPVTKVAKTVEQLQRACITNLSDGLLAMAKGDLKVEAIKETTPMNLSQLDEIGEMSRVVDRMIVRAQAGIDNYELVRKTVLNLISQTQILTHAGKAGQLDTRGDEKQFEGSYRDIVAGINDTLNAVITPVKEGTGILKQISDGDLTIRMTGDYSGDHQLIKNSINNLADALAEIIREVSEAVQATASASNQISASTEEMASGAHEQASQTNEVACAVQEMAKTILETTEHANNAAVNSKTASERAKEGVNKANNSLEGIQDIYQSSRVTAEIITQLSGKSDQIGEITQVIDDIADQTNLLALNAAIEAARAGEHGRGFAVVADEVRKLAERTSLATKEITATIKSIQNEVHRANESMENAKSSVNHGKEQIEGVAASLVDISHLNDSLSDMIAQVAAASEQQAATSDQISRSVEGISVVTSQSAQGTQQIARAAEDLNRLTENLQYLLGRFRIEVNSSVNTNRFLGLQNNRAQYLTS
ncbi:MAG: methyl-accepting chemotaxis protein [Ignavibacteria bacterium]|nr:methyl-accepting chemotaxis protein [Ignavibacteria bacterium]